MTATQQATQVVIELNRNGSARCEAWLSDTVRFLVQHQNPKQHVHFEYDAVMPNYSKFGTCTLT